MKTRTIFLLCSLACITAFSQTRPKSEDDYYRIVTIPIPHDVELEVGGLAVLPDGRLAASTRKGEVWMISNPYSIGNREPIFKRFAHGLHEPLGLLYRGDDFLVTQRGEVTRLIDSNEDGEADIYESFRNGLCRETIISIRMDPSVCLTVR